MRFDILTLFPAMFNGPFTESMVKRAQQAGHIAIHLHAIRDYTTDRHRTADCAPYGGGAGMVMKAEPLAKAIRAVLAVPDDTSATFQTDKDNPMAVPPLLPGNSRQLGDSALLSETTPPPVLLMSPDGEPFTQYMAEQFSRYERLVLVCGHYEGIDERLRTTLITREISIGDYVLTGGELAAMVIVDAVTRLVPGVLDAASTMDESHNDGLLEYPHYTRPAVWEDRAVPPVLLSGNHAVIAAWRQRQRLIRTLQRRPDMLIAAAARGVITDEDVALLWAEELL
jgi:tRNA (guanine37-N1)-methyltransferase